jgi:hypothetical protein
MDVNNLKLDGMELVAGESGLKRMVSCTYLVQTRPYEDHMNRGNFALIVVDYIRFDFKEVRKSMDELNDLGISGLAVSVVDDKEPIPKSIIKRANEIHKGDNTQIHGQSITPTNFNTIKAIVSKPVNPTPPALAFADTSVFPAILFSSLKPISLTILHYFFSTILTNTMYITSIKFFNFIICWFMPI